MQMYGFYIHEIHASHFHGLLYAGPRGWTLRPISWVLLCVCVCVCVCVCAHACVHMCTHLVAFNYFATPWTVAQQPPLSMGFSRQKYWSVFSSLGDLWDPWIETASLASPALAGRFLTTAPPGKPGSSFPPGCMILEHITISCPHLLNNTQTHTHTHTLPMNI